MTDDSPVKKKCFVCIMVNYTSVFMPFTHGTNYMDMAT